MKAASGTAEVRLTLFLRSPEGVGYPTPAVIPAKAGITTHTGSSATRRNGVPMKAASGTVEVRLTLLLRSPEGDGDPQPRRHSCEGRNHEAPKLIRDSARRRTKEGCERNGRGTANPLAAVTRWSWISQPRRHSCEGRNHEAPKLIRDSARRRTDEGRQLNGRGTANPLAVVNRRSWISQPRRHSCEGRNHEAPRLIRDSAQPRTDGGSQRNGRGTANPLAAVTRRRSGFLPAQE